MVSLVSRMPLTSGTNRMNKKGPREDDDSHMDPYCDAGHRKPLDHARLLPPTRLEANQ